MPLARLALVREISKSAPTRQMSKFMARRAVYEQPVDSPPRPTQPPAASRSGEPPAAAAPPEEGTSSPAARQTAEAEASSAFVITDLLGKTFSTGSVLINKTIINTSELSSGSYIIRLLKKDGTVEHKSFIVK